MSSAMSNFTGRTAILHGVAWEWASEGVGLAFGRGATQGTPTAFVIEHLEINRRYHTAKTVAIEMQLERRGGKGES